MLANILLVLIPLQGIEHNGPLALIVPATVSNLQPGDIAYLSCEPGNKPNAIVLYSVYAATCNFDALGDSQYSFIYTMQNASSSRALMDGLQKNNPPFPFSNIYANETSSADAADNQSSSTDTAETGNLVDGLVFGIITPIAVIAMGLQYYFCIKRKLRRRKQRFMRAEVSRGKAHLEGDSPHLYFQQKAELDDEQRRHEMEAVEVRYEMEGEGEIRQITVEGRGRERHSNRQEMRGEEHSKELDDAL